MLDDLLLHPATRRALESVIEQNTHAVMFIGPLGSGKLTIAQKTAQQLLGLTSGELLEKYPYFRHFRADNAVSIDQIRTLQTFLQLKTTGKGTIRRVAIIEDAHTMTIEAQNALLKILEEPPADTCLLLTVQGERSLKPTIYSRVQRVSIKPPSLAMSKEYFQHHGHTETAIQKAYLIADGGVGLISLLLGGGQDHPLQAAIILAKELISAKPYERLLRADELGKAKDTIPSLLYALKRVSMAALETAAQKGQNAQVGHWHKALGAIFDAEANLSTNPNIKLLLTNLFLML
jgi:DNA polymerase III subunit delta'